MATHLYSHISDSDRNNGEAEAPGGDTAVVVPGTDSLRGRDEASSAPDHLNARRRRAGWRRLAVPAVLLAGLGSGLAWVLSNNVQEEPATMLGATDEVDGGLARIHGIIPLETDGWAPPQNAAALDEPVADGAHRVRVLLELTALEAAGIDFQASNYSIEGLGAGEPRVIWSSPTQVKAAQGETIEATLVFEIPNRAVDLVLSGEDDLRLSMGTDHHTPAG